jgi:N utilization substance protein B
MMETGARYQNRHRSRELALQVLYQCEITHLKVATALKTFWSVKPTPESEKPFATLLAEGTIEHLDEIDPLIARSVEHWRPSRLVLLDRLILRMAVFEFLYTSETPKPVVINEALELARTFSADDSVAFINGVLDDIRIRLERDGPVTIIAPAVGDGCAS